MQQDGRGAELGMRPLLERMLAQREMLTAKAAGNGAGRTAIGGPPYI